jgi:acetyltransferase-like isoleucine patch superfamily enzyme
MSIFKKVKYKFKKYNLRKKIRQIYKVNNVNIIKPYTITDFDKINFKNFVYIGPESYIIATGEIDIGENVIIGPRLTILTLNHNYKSNTMVPYDETVINSPVIIEDNVWIGAYVQICPGTTIGEGSIIGMGAVVRGKIPPYSIVIGNPAKIVGKRDEEEYKKIIINNGQYLKNKYSKSQN